MRSFIAWSGRTGRWGSRSAVLVWAIEMSVGRVVKVATARPGEKRARIVAEVEDGAVRASGSGFFVPVRELVRFDG